MDGHELIHQVASICSHDEAYAWEVLPALAGETIATGDPTSISELADILSRHVFEQRPHANVANATLAMIRTHTIASKAHWNH